MNHIFISHSSLDKEIADKIVEFLEKKNIPCWIAPRNILAGSDWAGSIMKAMKESKAMVLVLSENSNNSVQVLREVERIVGLRKSIIPFRIGNFTLSDSMEYFLMSQHWLNFNGDNLEKALSELENCITQKFPDVVESFKKTAKIIDYSENNSENLFHENEDRDWQTAISNNSEDDFIRFIEKYPNGKNNKLALNYLQKLRQENVKSNTVIAEKQSVTDKKIQSDNPKLKVHEPESSIIKTNQKTATQKLNFWSYDQKSRKSYFIWAGSIIPLLIMEGLLFDKEPFDEIVNVIISILPFILLPYFFPIKPFLYIFLYLALVYNVMLIILDEFDNEAFLIITVVAFVISLISFGVSYLSLKRKMK